MKITPYTFALLKDGNYFFIESVSKRRVDSSTLPDKIIKGYLLKKSVVSLDGESTKSILNIKTANYQKIVNFLFASSKCEENAWAYVNEIDKIIKTKSITFSIPDVDLIE